MKGEKWDPRYDEILYREHPVSREHPSMPLRERAAQFASFKALVGFEDEIEEERRWTEAEIELDESRKEELNTRLRLLWEYRNERPEAEFIWFQADGRKAGGSYRHTRGSVKAIDPLKKRVFLDNGEAIPLEALRDVRSDCLSEE